jgi:hypothetical protein
LSASIKSVLYLKGKSSVKLYSVILYYKYARIAIPDFYFSLFFVGIGIDVCRNSHFTHRISHKKIKNPLHCFAFCGIVYFDIKIIFYPVIDFLTADMI